MEVLIRYQNPVRVMISFVGITFQAQDWDLPHRPMTPSRILDQQNGSSFMFRSGAPGPAILNRTQPAFKRGYLVKKGDCLKVLNTKPSHLKFSFER